MFKHNCIGCLPLGSFKSVEGECDLYMAGFHCNRGLKMIIARYGDAPACYLKYDVDCRPTQDWHFVGLYLANQMGYITVASKYYIWGSEIYTNGLTVKTTFTDGRLSKIGLIRKP